jgi:hypothetical protein
MVDKGPTVCRVLYVLHWTGSERLHAVRKLVLVRLHYNNLICSTASPDCYSNDVLKFDYSGGHMHWHVWRADVFVVCQVAGYRDIMICVIYEVSFNMLSLMPSLLSYGTSNYCLLAD